jgi:hypothetical protein
LHGFALAAEKIVGSGLDGDGRRRWWNAALSRGVALLVVWVGWVFFRSNDFSVAILILKKMFLGSVGVSWAHPFALLVLGLLAAQHIAVALGWSADEQLQPDRWYTPVILFFMLGLAILFYPKGFTPFIYFQF